MRGSWSRRRGEQFRQRRGGARGDIRVECRAGAARLEQLSGQIVRVGAGDTPGGHLFGQAAPVLDQDDAQRDGHGPQLADGQRLHTLVGGNEAPQGVRIDMAVGMRDKGPGKAKYARVSGEGTLAELGQLAIVARRQVIADLADLRLHQVVVVQQPFGRGHHGPAALQLRRAGPVGREQYFGIVVEAAAQRAHARGLRGDGLGGGKALRMLLQPLDAEQLLAHRRLVVPRRRGGCVLERTA